MKTVSHILQAKSENIHHCGPSSSVLDALKEMMDKNISALLVMEGDKLEGIFTERDYARKIILQGRSSSDTLLREVMTADLKTIELTTTIDECMQIMTHLHIRHLPVLEAGKVRGIISIGDLVKFVIEDQKQTIQQLQSYISS